MEKILKKRFIPQIASPFLQLNDCLNAGTIYMDRQLYSRNPNAPIVSTEGNFCAKCNFHIL